MYANATKKLFAVFVYVRIVRIIASVDETEKSKSGDFIDIQNLYHSSKIYTKRVNYKEFIKELIGDRQLIVATAYVVNDAVEANRLLTR